MECPHQNESNSSEPAYLPSSNNKKYDGKKDKTYYQQHEDGINTETEDDDDDDIQIIEEIDDDEEEDDDNNTCIDNDNETYVYAATPTTEKSQKDRDNAIIQQQSKALSTENDYNKDSKDNTKNLINGIQLSETFTQEEKNPNDNIEEDDEFDWNEDPEIKLKRSRTAREKLKEKNNNTYCCWHYLTPLVQRSIIALVGSSIFIIISLCVQYLIPRATPEQQSDPNFRNIRDNVQVWMWWACFMWTDAWVIAVIVHLVPSAVSLWVKIFSGSRSERVKTHLIYYMSMKRYTTLLLLGLTNWATFHVLRFNLFPSIQNQSYSITVAKVFGFISVLTIFLFVQKILMLIISVTFHCSAYDDRIEALKYSRSVLDALSKAEDKRFNPVCCPNVKLPGIELSDNRGDSSNNTAEGQGQPIAPGNSTQEKIKNFGKKLKSYIITDNPELFGKIEEKDVDVTSKKYAKKVAKKLFYALAYPYGIPRHLYKPNGKIGGTKMLEKHHFRPFFKSDEEVEQAFNIFDKDGNGDISRKEFRDTVIGIYEERALLSECIKDTSQALGKVDIILFIVFLIIAIFVCMSTIFGVNLYQILLPLGTFIMGLSFMFSETVKVAFQSIMFLFVTHPYDIGDVVYIDDVRLTVFNMGISGTIFIRSDGQKMYAPTSVLMTKFIYNARRSGDMGESVLFSVDFRTPTDLIFTLRDRLDEWVSNHPRDFTSGFDVRISDIINVNKVVLSAWIPHKGNWQDGGKRLQRLNKFMFYLKDTLHELNIQYELPPQQYTTDSFYKDVQNTSLVSSAYKDDYKTTKLFKNSKMQGDVDN
ncbi:Mechanosensitive ion channel-domain-containing protein [Cunninghamella echinulata]|nr:Mechanosensitive ion channel-domain-containing protein [Cunninghamella echinulata]